ncbi:MAG: hypothetical protein MK086_08255 [Flavobacteriales bacterium]|nr:hypothetical protein [Flavobacteriales bacterium]
MKKTLVIALAFTLNSCAFHFGNISSNASFDNGNFKILTIASGQAQTIHVFGIGGLDKDALVLEAKKDMYQKYPLSDGQIFGNITVDYKREFYFVVVKTLVTVSADVVQFNPTDQQKENDLFSNLSSVDPIESNPEQSGLVDRGFEPGEMVGVFLNRRFDTMFIIESSGKKRYSVISPDSSRFIVETKSIYSLNDGKTTYSHGVRVGQTLTWSSGKEESSGTALGIRPESIIVKDIKGAFIKILPDQLIKNN